MPINCKTIFNFSLVKKKKREERKAFMNVQNVFILIGYPASGKSTFARQSTTNSNGSIIILDGDSLKTSQKVVSELKKNLDAGRSVIVDACNNSVERRNAIIVECHARGIPVYAFYFQVTMEECMQRAKQREDQGGPHISKIAFYTMRKKFILPDMSEGFSGIQVI